MNENIEKNEIEENLSIKPKKNKVIIIILILLIIILLGLTTLIIYNKYVSKDNIIDEKEKEEIIDEDEIKVLKDNIFDLSIDNDNKYYFNFINDTEYECTIKNYETDNENIDYVSKGTYTYDGKNIKLSDEKINVILKDSMLYVNFNNFSLNNDNSKYYDVYFERSMIIEEFANIGLAAANKRRDEWNKNHSIKMIMTEGTIDRCYKNEKDKNDFSCSITIKQFFEEYDQYLCENDSKSVYQESVISSGKCEENYSTFWSFSSVDKSKNGYNVYGSWTGM